MSDKVKSKLSLLQLIKEEKDVLFNRSKSHAANIAKTNKWNQITQTAKSNGILSSNIKSEYLRGTLWHNFKRRLEKHKRQNSTDEIDDLVLEIIG